jgi:hypothetical protein
LLVTCPNPHPGAPTRPSTPKVLRARDHARTFYPSVVSCFGLTVESIKEFGGVSKALQTGYDWLTKDYGKMEAINLQWEKTLVKLENTCLQ